MEYIGQPTFIGFVYSLRQQTEAWAAAAMSADLDLYQQYISSIICSPDHLWYVLHIQLRAFVKKLPIKKLPTWGYVTRGKHIWGAAGQGSSWRISSTPSSGVMSAKGVASLPFAASQLDPDHGLLQKAPPSHGLLQEAVPNDGLFNKAAATGFYPSLAAPGTRLPCFAFSKYHYEQPKHALSLTVSWSPSRWSLYWYLDFCDELFPKENMGVNFHIPIFFGTLP